LIGNIQLKYKKKTEQKVTRKSLNLFWGFLKTPAMWVRGY